MHDESDNQAFHCQEEAKYGTLECRLANGHRLQIQIKHVSMHDNISRRGIPWDYWSIRFRLCGDQFDERMRFYAEFRGGLEFDPEALPSIWKWINELVLTRDFYDYDDIDALLEDVASKLACHFSKDDDLCDHITNRSLSDSGQDDDSDDETDASLF